MKKAFAVLIAFFISVPCASAATRMKPGEWRMTSRVEMSGVPFAMPAQTFTRCFSEMKQAVTPENKNAGCRMEDYRVSGNTATWKVVCKNGTAMTGESAISADGTSIKGKTAMVIKGRKMTTTMSGKWIGPCPQAGSSR